MRKRRKTVPERIGSAIGSAVSYTKDLFQDLFPHYPGSNDIRLKRRYRARSRRINLESRFDLSGAMEWVSGAKEHVLENYKPYLIGLGAVIGAAAIYQVSDRITGREPDAPLPTHISESYKPKYEGTREVPFIPPNYSKEIAKSSRKHDLDINLAMALFGAESHFQHYDDDFSANGLRDGKHKIKTSPLDCKGIGQLCEEAVQWLNYLEYKKTGDKRLVTINKKRDEVTGELETIILGKSEGRYSWKKAQSDPATNMDYSVETMRDLKDRIMEKGVKDHVDVYESVAASYILGFGKVTRAMASAGSNDFWKYSKHLDFKDMIAAEKYVRKVMSHWFMYSQFDFPTESKKINSGVGLRKIKKNGKWVTEYHPAVDIGPLKYSSKRKGIAGDSVHAPASGIVLDVNYNRKSNGNCIKIGYGKPQWGLYADFLHLEDCSIKLKPGDLVEKGRVIGKMGGTPNVPVHLHFGIRNKYLVPNYFDPDYIFNDLVYTNNAYAKRTLPKAPLKTIPANTNQGVYAKNWVPQKAPR